MTPTFARQPLPEERRILEEWIKNPPSRDHYLRARIVLLSADGLSAPDIARRIGRHESRVRMWIRQFNRFGIEGLQSGKPSEAKVEKAPIHSTGSASPESEAGDSPYRSNGRQRHRRASEAERWTICSIPERAEGE